VAGERILLVEDAAEVRQFLADTVLRFAGYDVLTAANGAEGLTLARDLSPDLIIADHLMPEYTGLQMLAALQEEDIFLPFILITAEGSEELAVQALRLGVNDYLIKPFDPDDLLNAVQRVLREHWTRQITERIPNLLLETNRVLEQRLHDLDTLVRIGQRVTSLLDLQPVLNEVSEAAVMLTGADEGGVFLLDEVTEELYLYASTQDNFSTDGSFRLPVSDSLAGQVVKSGEPVILEGEDLRKVKTNYLIHDAVYMPLKLQGQVIGVLGVTNAESRGKFETHTLQLVRVLADFAAIAIHNARLYTSTEQERETLDAILRDTEDPIVVTDKQENILFCNPASVKTFNLYEENLRGKPLAKVFPHEKIIELFGRPVRQGRSRSSEIHLESGRVVLNAQLTVIEGVGKIAVMQDITHLKELDRIKSEFVTTVSHDLRSPLTTILGYVELLKRSGPLNERQQDFVGRVVGSVRSITTLITDLLELGKIEAGFDLDRESISLHPIVRDAVEGLRPLWEAKHLGVETTLNENGRTVLGNPLRMRQMVNNLVENAIKYTPEGGRIRVVLEEDSDFLVLRVADTGIGIPQKDQPYIFDKFYRSDEAIDFGPGTGLGLSIVKGIVDQLQGRIWVESQIGKGTMFTVMLPTV